MSEDGSVSYRALSSGLLRDLRRRVPNPVVAFGLARLFHVQVHGDGFVLPVAGRPVPIRGFFTSCVVAAPSVDLAKERALEVVTRRWRRDGHLARAGAPKLEVTEVQPISGRWRLRSGGGYTFYAAEEA